MITTKETKEAMVEEWKESLDYKRGYLDGEEHTNSYWIGKVEKLKEKAKGILIMGIGSKDKFIREEEIDRFLKNFTQEEKNNIQN